MTHFAHFARSKSNDKNKLLTTCILSDAYTVYIVVFGCVYTITQQDINYTGTVLYRVTGCTICETDTKFLGLSSSRIAPCP